MSDSREKLQALVEKVTEHRNQSVRKMDKLPHKNSARALHEGAAAAFNTVLCELEALLAAQGAQQAIEPMEGITDDDMKAIEEIVAERAAPPVQGAGTPHELSAKWRKWAKVVREKAPSYELQAAGWEQAANELDAFCAAHQSSVEALRAEILKHAPFGAGGCTCGWWTPKGCTDGTAEQEAWREHISRALAAQEKPPAQPSEGGPK